MRLFAFSLAMLTLAVHGDYVSAQDAYGGSPRMIYRDSHFAPAPPQDEGYYRWRPLEEGETSMELSQRQSQPAASVGDYTDEPFGLPPGTYRPIEQRHTITPHLEGFRFRPIVPEEQLRNRARNERQDQVLSDQGQPQSTDHMGGKGAYPMGRQSPAYKFRPDPRLDTPTRGAPSRYAFPMGSEAPRFRSR